MANIVSIATSRQTKRKQSAAQKPRPTGSGPTQSTRRGRENAKAYGLACIESVREFIPKLISGHIVGTTTADELRAMVEYATMDLEGAEEALLELARHASRKAVNHVDASAEE